MVARRPLRTALRIRPRCARPCATAGARGFADRMIARHSKGGAAPRALELLLSMRAPLFVQNVLQRCDVDITTPALMALARERSLQVPMTSSREPARRSSAAAHARRWTRQSNERGGAATTLLHLVQRTIRLESMPTHAAAADELAPSAQIEIRSTGEGTGELPVVRRSIDAPSMRKLIEQNNPRARDGKAGQPAHGESRDATVAGMTPRRPGSEVDIEHLADRVISSIDRRIVAQRERLGRP